MTRMKWPNRGGGGFGPPSSDRPRFDGYWGPPESSAALRNHPTALRHFEALAPSQRRRYLAWIESAKREETKLRRLEEAIRLLASGNVLGLK